MCHTSFPTYFKNVIVSGYTGISPLLAFKAFIIGNTIDTNPNAIKPINPIPKNNILSGIKAGTGREHEIVR